MSSPDNTPERPTDAGTKALCDMLPTLQPSPEASLPAHPQPRNPLEFNEWSRTAGGAAEEYLTNIGAFAGAAPNRSNIRAVLGCFGCQVLRDTTGDNKAYAEQIERCTGIGTGTVRDILFRLTRTRVLSVEEKTSTEGRGGARRVLYQPARTRSGRSLLGQLQTPEPCLKQSGDQLVRLNADAEDYLIDTGVGTARSIDRRETLGCIACQLRLHGTVEPANIARCQGLKPESARKLLNQLQEEGVMDAKPAETNLPGRPPLQYSLRRNIAASRLASLLQVPPKCSLGQETTGDINDVNHEAT